MPSRDKFDICERTGCLSRATHLVRHDMVSRDPDNQIKTCYDHAVWWCKGWDGMRIGTMTLIDRKGVRPGKNAYSTP